MVSEKDKTPASKLAHYIMRNAVDLVLKYSTTPDGKRRVNSAPVQKAERDDHKLRCSASATVNNRKAEVLVKQMTKDVKKEMKTLSKQPSDVLLLVANTLDYSVQTYSGDPGAEGNVDWDNAPVMKVSSHSDTGGYVRDTLVEVSQEMQRDGEIPTERAMQIRELVSDAVTEVTLKSKNEDLRPNLAYGDEMIDLAGKILTGRKGDECHAQRLSAGFVTTLVRSVLNKLKKAMVYKAFTETELKEMVSILDADLIETDQGDTTDPTEAQKRLKDQLEQCQRRLMTSDSISKLIAQAVSHVAKKRDVSDEHIKTHIADATKQFIARVVDTTIAQLDKQESEKSGNAGQHNNTNANNCNENSGRRSIFPFQIQRAQTERVIDNATYDRQQIRPMIGGKPLAVDHNLIEDALSVISIKEEKDLFDNSRVAKRNSFRNVQRPDLSQVRNYHQISEKEVANKIENHVMQLRHLQEMSESDGRSTEGSDDDEAHDVEGQRVSSVGSRELQIVSDSDDWDNMAESLIDTLLLQHGVTQYKK